MMTDKLKLNIDYKNLLDILICNNKLQLYDEHLWFVEGRFTGKEALELIHSSMNMIVSRLHYNK